MKVLVSAYACEPGRGSEGEIGWSLVHELARTNDVWVITRANNKSAHEGAFLNDGKPARLHFIYYDLPKWARWYKKGKRFFLIYYYLWQIGTIFEARQFLKHEQVDLAHHLTGGMDWMPSGLAFLNLPFLWGPVGSEEIHPGILRTLPSSVRGKEFFRKAVRSWCRRIDPLVRLTGRRAQIILSHTPENLPKRYHGKIVPYVQTGIQPTPRFAKMRTDFSRQRDFTIVYAGELIHWKGAAYAVDAFIEFAKHHKDARLIMIGGGPLRPQLERTINASGLQGRVDLLGKVPMVTLIEKLALGDVFLYPSYHHGLATVVLQAMLTGLPVVCLEGDAIGRVVQSRCGVTVPVAGKIEFERGLSKALSYLYENESARILLARQAQASAKANFSYESIGRGYTQIYESLLNKTPAKSRADGRSF